MKKQKKYTVPVRESYQSGLDEKKQKVLNGVSYATCIISLICAIRLIMVNGRSFNLTPAAITLYVCEIIMSVSMILSVHTDHQKEETVSYHELMRSHGILMISGLAGMLFGLAAFQKPPGTMILLWICIITAGVCGIGSGVVYTSYQKVKR